MFFNKTMQKLSGKLAKAGLHCTSGNRAWGDPSFASPNNHPWLLYI